MICDVFIGFPEQKAEILAEREKTAAKEAFTTLDIDESNRYSMHRSSNKHFYTGIRLPLVKEQC